MLTTPRLTLRRFAAGDAPAMHAILSDPRAMAYWSTPPHHDVAQTEGWIGRTVAAVAAGECDDFAVTCEGRLIGKAGLWQGAELGFVFAPSAWGRGYATEAVTAILARAWTQGIETVTADVDPRNAASLRLLRRCGFVETGRAMRTFCVGGVWTDSVYLATYCAGCTTTEPVVGGGATTTVGCGVGASE